MVHDAARRIQGLSRHLCESVAGSESAAGVMVVGGMVMDTLSVPSTPLQPGTSVPGEIRQHPGGVARNIAQALATLLPPSHVRLVSVVGVDPAGSALLSHWASTTGCPTAGILTSPNARTPSVSAILDTKGDLVACVADTGAVESDLTVDWVCKQLGTGPQPGIVLLDANMGEETLAAVGALCAMRCIPVFFEPVSVVKSVRVCSLVQSVTYLKPNADELMAIAAELRKRNQGSIPAADLGSWQLDACSSGRSHQSDLQAAAAALLPDIFKVLTAGVKHIILSLGPLGCAACCLRSSVGTQRHHVYVSFVPALECHLRSVNGAGDCLVAGTLFGLHESLSILQSVACGVVAAAAACESVSNVPPNLSRQHVLAGVNSAMRHTWTSCFSSAPL